MLSATIVSSLQTNYRVASDKVLSSLHLEESRGRGWGGRLKKGGDTDLFGRKTANAVSSQRCPGRPAIPNLLSQRPSFLKCQHPSLSRKLRTYKQLSFSRSYLSKVRMEFLVQPQNISWVTDTQTGQFIRAAQKAKEILKHTQVYHLCEKSKGICQLDVSLRTRDTELLLCEVIPRLSEGCEQSADPAPYCED